MPVSAKSLRKFFSRRVERGLFSGLQPARPTKEPGEARLIRGKRQQPKSESLAVPPLALRVPGPGEGVSIQDRSNIAGRVVGEWIRGEKAECVCVVVEKLPDQVKYLVNTYGAFGAVGRERLNVVFEGTDADMPDDTAEWKAYSYKGLPVDPAKMPPQVAPYQLRLDWQMWFAAMSIPAAYQRVERSVHDLIPRKQVCDRISAEKCHDSGHGAGDRLLRAAGARACGGGFGAADERTGKDFPPDCIVETGQRRHDCQPIKEGEIPAQDQRALKKDDHSARGTPRRARAEDEPRRHEFRHVIEIRSGAQERSRQEVKPAA